MEYAQQKLDEGQKTILNKKKEERTDWEILFITTSGAELVKLDEEKKQWMEMLKNQSAQRTLLNSGSTSSATPSQLITSCRLFSVGGICITGRHVDRNKKCQKKFRKKVKRRDKGCIATGDVFDVTAAHIVPLNQSQLITRELLFSPKNGVLLRSCLEDDYERHMWVFDEKGDVTPLYEHWVFRKSINRVNLSTNPQTGPLPSLIKQHNALAFEAKKHHCPYCWRYVGEVNIDAHKAGSCEALDSSSEDD